MSSNFFLNLFFSFPSFLSFFFLDFKEILSMGFRSSEMRSRHLFSVYYIVDIDVHSVEFNESEFFLFKERNFFNRSSAISSHFNM